ncbi:YncE family protein [Cytobacillus sp. FJAT-53684]|uniref:YncE family protein n=1 Tax=Cytobacillus mangrovibacter TaxID=3299024 RepID=A0ABW6K4J9_9BACI
MKKMTVLAISLITSISLAACGNTTDNKDKEEVSLAQNEQVESASFYFTANEGGISKVDATTNKVIETIEVEGSVHNVQISPDDKIIGATVVPSGAHGAHAEQTEKAETQDEHGKAHGSNGEETTEAHSEHNEDGHGEKINGMALFFNAETNELIKQVDVGSHPAHIVFTEDNKYAVVTNNEDNNISVIDLTTYEVSTQVTTGKGPHGFRISKDSKFAYIANMGEDTVSVIDMESMKETKKITVGKVPVTTGITTDGNTLVTTLNGENSLAIVDLTTDEVEKVEVGEGPAQVYIQSDDKFAFVANQGTPENPSNSVTKVDLETKEVVATIEVGKGAHGIVTSDDNKYVYATNMYDNTVSVIDNNSNEVIATVSVGGVPNGITIQ